METREFRFKRGQKILDYMRKFSATEKVVFGIFVILAAISALIMTAKVSDYFKVEIPAYGGELREGIVGLPRTINPVLAITDVDKDLSAIVYSGLMKYQDGKLIPDLAKSYSISNDSLTYTFILRPNIYFQDGKPLTTDDIEFTIQKIQNPAMKSPRRADWANVTVKKVSPTEIRFILKQAYSPFISNTTLGILPKHIWGNVSDDQFIYSLYNIEPIGSGPYKVTTVTRDNGGIPVEYTLSTWNKYYGQEPYISTLRALFYADFQNALEALDSGSIDSLSTIPPATATILANESAQSYKIVSTSMPRVFGIFFNQNQSPIVADKIVRQALEMSVDRLALIKEVLNGFGNAITGPLPSIADENSNIPTTTNSTSTVNTKPITNANSTSTTNANIAKAQTLLEKNGWKKNASGIYSKKGKTATTTLSFELFTSDAPDLKQTAELVKNTWNKLGANVTVKVFESGDLYQNIIKTRKYDALLFGQQISKDRDLYAFWHSSQRNSPGLNVAMYANSRVDSLLNNIRTSNDDANRQENFKELEQLINSDLPAIFLYSPDFIYAVPKEIQNISLSTVASPSDRWNTIADWFIKTEKVWKIFGAER